MKLSLCAAVLFTALLAGCATGPYDATYAYGYGAGPGYYGPDYGYYGPDYGYSYGPSYYYGPDFGFSYFSGDGHDGHHSDHWSGSRSYHQGSVQTHPGVASRSYAQSRFHGRNGIQGHAHVASAPARSSAHLSASHVASARTGPDREHGG